MPTQHLSVSVLHVSAVVALETVLVTDLKLDGQKSVVELLDQELVPHPEVCCHLLHNLVTCYHCD